MVHERLLMPFLLYGNETMIWREKDRSRIRAVQIDNLRSLIEYRMYKLEIYEEVAKGMDKRID